MAITFAASMMTPVARPSSPRLSYCRVFNVLDTKHVGFLNWHQFLRGIHILERGSRKELLQFLFNVHITSRALLVVASTHTTCAQHALMPWQVYDVDNDGVLSKAELFRFFLASLRVSVNENIEEVQLCWLVSSQTRYERYSHPLNDFDQLSVNFVDSVFSKLDPDGRGYIVMANAERYLEQHPEVTDVLAIFGRTMANASLSSVSTSGGLPHHDAGMGFGDGDDEGALDDGATASTASASSGTRRPRPQSVAYLDMSPEACTFARHHHHEPEPSRLLSNDESRPPCCLASGTRAKQAAADEPATVPRTCKGSGGCGSRACSYGRSGGQAATTAAQGDSYRPHRLPRQGPRCLLTGQELAASTCSTARAGSRHCSCCCC